MDEIPLTEEDRAILELECPTVAGHTCKLIVLGAGAPDAAGIRSRIADRIGEAEILTRRLGGEDSQPTWIADPSFELERHVVADPGPPLDRAGLSERVAELFAERLDRDGPLWRIDVVRLRDARTALIWRIHHALADGTAAIRFARTILWDRDEAEDERPARGSSGPGAPHADDQRRRGHLAGFLRREFSDSIHRSPFDAEIGTRRAIAFAEVPFAPLHDAAKRLCGASVNDAVLSVVAGAVRGWLEHHRGGALGSIRLRVPVSLHHEGDSAGNRDSFFTLPVSLAEPDPLARLRGIHQAEAERKAEHDAERLDSLLHSLRSASPGLEHLAERFESSARSFALCVSNVPGPRGPVTVGGAELESLHSLAEVGEHHGLRISVVSAAGNLCFGLCADPAIAPDLDQMAAALQVEAEALIAAAAD